MKWTWDKFDFHEPDRDPPGQLEAIFARLIPEVADGRLKIVSVARDVDLVKVVVRGAALDWINPQILHQIGGELGVKTIQVIPWSDDPKLLISNILQPARVEQVLICSMIGRAIVLVRDDQLSLAIGFRAQNVRLASKVCGWDIEIMTATKLEEQIGRGVLCFSKLEGITEELAQQLVEQGYLSYDDLCLIDPDDLMEMGSLTAELADHIIEQAECFADGDIDPNG
jgi:N utilization substance protein A